MEMSLEDFKTLWPNWKRFKKMFKFTDEQLYRGIVKVV